MSKFQSPDSRPDHAPPGFLPLAEGAALVEAATAANASLGPFLEVGSYRGKSASYLGPVARQLGTVLFCVDHHRSPNSDPDSSDTLVAADDAVADTLPKFRQAIQEAELEDTVIAVIGKSATVAQYWSRDLSLLFLNGSHDEDELRSDFDGWVSRVAVGGLAIIHGVATDPDEGSTAPYEHLYLPVVRSGEYKEVKAVGSLRILRRVEVVTPPAQPIRG